ncbi:hypothetical protein ASZ78_014612 [Callipepla squamata]|uniref:Coiled-coil domain-containing protein 33 n=1 Tax=Callipepla squamata TaxID=9009 RepID=A0A226NDL6_CALSU|nr:hypothetical protein ASZ78_014612 [Callipepla squamata]
MAGESRIPASLQRWRLRAEDKALDFEFEVLSAQFNRCGRYALRLVVENPLLQDSGTSVQLSIGDEDSMPTSAGTTDTVLQAHLGEICTFQRRKFTFTLPRGFCKNDKNHDVRLRIEALHCPGTRLRRRRVGEAFFAIYPRPDQPRVKLLAGQDEDWYRYSTVLALLRAGSEQPAMHCGRLAFTAALREHRSPPEMSPVLSPHAQERGHRAAGAALSPTSPAGLFPNLHRDTVALPPVDAVSSVLPRTQQRSQDVPQEREVSRYRLALRRMAGDLVSLQQRVTSLEVENGHLRHSLAGRQEPGHALLTDGDVDVMTREEVLDRLATLKGELVSSTAEMRQLRDRVQRLQNELIRKNDQEKELVLLQRAHRQQQAALRRCQEEVARTKGLEEMVRQQEKVIRVMERMLQEKLSRSAEKTAGGHLPLPVLPPHRDQGLCRGDRGHPIPCDLQFPLSRGTLLEQPNGGALQLEEAARRWAREKQELGTRLLEQDHGFGGSVSRLLRATTLKRFPDPTFPPRRPRTLEPLP